MQTQLFQSPTSVNFQNSISYALLEAVVITSANESEASDSQSSLSFINLSRTLLTSK